MIKKYDLTLFNMVATDRVVSWDDTWLVRGIVSPRPIRALYAFICCVASGVLVLLHLPALFVIGIYLIAVGGIGLPWMVTVGNTNEVIAPEDFTDDELRREADTAVRRYAHYTTLNYPPLREQRLEIQAQRRVTELHRQDVRLRAGH